MTAGPASHAPSAPPRGVGAAFPAEAADVTGALSPSRAADFMQCPLLYRFRVVDRLPEAPSAAAVRGTVVHAVLERIFDLPAAARTVDAAAELLGPQWHRLRTEEPDLSTLFGDDEEGAATWLAGAHTLLSRWFELEDPTRIEPAERELYVEALIEGAQATTVLDDPADDPADEPADEPADDAAPAAEAAPAAPAGPLLLRGYVDRLDVAPDGRMRIVDYKTGRAPREVSEAKALFQLKFYALVLWRVRGAVPAMLQLVYLGSGEILRYAPDEADLLATERKVRALWTAIERAARTGDWRPSPSRMCAWCDHKPRCPAFGGTPPPLPEGVLDRVVAPTASALRTPGLDEE